jgi:hypothetical protein
LRVSRSSIRPNRSCGAMNSAICSMYWWVLNRYTALGIAITQPVG